jgi:hypothetical protein
MAQRELLESEHLGEGVYIHDEGHGIVLAVNDHRNKVIHMEEREIAGFLKYVKRAGLIKEG